MNPEIGLISQVNPRTAYQTLFHPLNRIWLRELRALTTLCTTIRRIGKAQGSRAETGAVRHIDSCAHKALGLQGDTFTVDPSLPLAFKLASTFGVRIEDIFMPDDDQVSSQ